MKKGVLKNFAKLTGKHLCQSFFFNKVALLKPATLLKKILWHRCFPVNFAKFLRTLFLQRTSGSLILNLEVRWKLKRQPSRGILIKRCSKNILQIYRRTLIPKCDFNKVAKNTFSEHLFLRIPRKSSFWSLTAQHVRFWQMQNYITDCLVTVSYEFRDCFI